jgi:hypothetical protein
MLPSLLGIVLSTTRSRLGLSGPAWDLKALIFRMTLYVRQPTREQRRSVRIDEISQITWGISI